MTLQCGSGSGSICKSAQCLFSSVWKTAGWSRSKPGADQDSWCQTRSVLEKYTQSRTSCSEEQDMWWDMKLCSSTKAHMCWKKQQHCAVENKMFCKAYLVYIKSPDIIIIIEFVYVIYFIALSLWFQLQLQFHTIGKEKRALTRPYKINTQIVDYFHYWLIWWLFF